MIEERWYPPTWRGRPASMPWGDWVIWQRFLLTPSALFDEYAYDVMLPISSPPASVTDPAMRKMWIENTAKRIDAVARKADALTILEVRDVASWQTLGQIIGYQTLAELHFPTELWTRPIIICGAISAGVEPAIRAQHIGVIVLAAPSVIVETGVAGKTTFPRESTLP